MNGGFLQLLLGKASDPGNEFVKGLFFVLEIIIGCAGALLTLYAVYLFFAMASASDEGKRRAVKNRIFKIGSSILIIVALIFMLQAIDVTIGTVKTYKEVEDNKVIKPDAPVDDKSFIVSVSPLNITVPMRPTAGKYVMSGSTTFSVASGNSKVTVESIKNATIQKPSTNRAFVNGKWEVSVENKTITFSYEERVGQAWFAESEFNVSTAVVRLIVELVASDGKTYKPSQSIAITANFV